MKKNIKLIFSAMMIFVCCALFSGCIVLVDGEYDDFNWSQFGTVIVENRDSNRTAYINEIRYCEEDSDSWSVCWTCPADHNDSDISFCLKSGTYKFEIEVIYPKYKHNCDYYDIFDTGNYANVRLYSGGQKTLVFDGEELYERW